MANLNLATLSVDILMEGYDKAQEQINGFQKSMNKVGADLDKVGKSISAKVTAPITALGASVIAIGQNFEASMSQVAAISGATGDDLEALSQAAKDMGSSTQFSASQAADALQYLALAGYNTEKSIETLPTILNLAAAGGIDLASASDMVTDAMSALGETAGTAESFVDKMAVTSQKSNTSVAQLGEAILTVGGTAKELSGGVTEMNTAIGILADNGIKGAEGGTALRNVILSLTAPTDKARDAMTSLGLEIFDATGNMRPLNEVFGDLDAQLSTLSQEDKINVLSDIFNKVDLKSVNALLANSGERFNELSGYIDDSTGAAETMAEVMNDNVKGAFTTLLSALEGTAIALYEGFQGPLKAVINTLATAVQGMIPFIEENATLIVVFAGVAAAIGPLLIVLGKLATAMAFLLTPVGAVIGIIGALIATIVACYNTNEEFRENVEKTWTLVKDKIDVLSAEIAKLVKAVVDKMKAFWDEHGESVTQIITNLWNILEDIFSNGLNIITDLVSVITSFIEGDFEGMKEAVMELMDSLWAFITETLDSVLTFVWDLGPKMFEAGKNMLNSLWNGWKSIWEGMQEWMYSKMGWLGEQLSSWKRSKKELESEQSSYSSSSPRSVGSHANGLDYVPFDGYQATLHQGERIVTASDNAAGTYGNNEVVQMLGRLIDVVDRIPQEMLRKERMMV